MGARALQRARESPPLDPRQASSAGLMGKGLVQKARGDKGNGLSVQV